MGDNSGEIEVRALDAADAAALRALRLRTLLEDPIPFLASHEEEASQPVEDLARRLQGLLRNAMKAGDVYFDEEELVLWLRGVPMLPQTGG